MGDVVLEEALHAPHFVHRVRALLVLRDILSVDQQVGALLVATPVVLSQALREEETVAAARAQEIA